MPPEDFVITNRATHIPQRRDHFLFLATKLIVEIGLRQATTANIADALGVKKTVLYRYFKSKEAMIDAVLERAIKQMLEADNAPKPTVGAVLAEILKQLREEPDGFLLLVRHAAHDPQFSHHFEHYRSTLAKRTETRLRASLVRLVPPATFAFCARVTTDFILETMAAWLETGAPEEDDAFIAWLYDSILALCDSWQGLLPTKRTRPASLSLRPTPDQPAAAADAQDPPRMPHRRMADPNDHEFWPLA